MSATIGLSNPGWFSKHGFYASHFSVAMIKYPDEKQLGEGRVHLAYTSRSQIVKSRKALKRNHGGTLPPVSCSTSFLHSSVPTV